MLHGTLNSKTNGEKLNAFPQRSVIRQVCPLSPLLVNVTLKVQTNAIKKLKIIKCIQFGKKEIQLIFHRLDDL